jgi:hypothetical protein
MSHKQGYPVKNMFIRMNASLIPQSVLEFIQRERLFSINALLLRPACTFICTLLRPLTASTFQTEYSAGSTLCQAPYRPIIHTAEGTSVYIVRA